MGNRTGKVNLASAAATRGVGKGEEVEVDGAEGGRVDRGSCLR